MDAFAMFWGLYCAALLACAAAGVFACVAGLLAPGARVTDRRTDQGA